MVDKQLARSATDKKGRNDLFYAVQQSNNESVVRALIAAGADANKTDNGGKTALFHAVQENNNNSVVRILIEAGVDVNMTDNEGKTALIYAVQQRNNGSVVRALIKAGADANIKYGQGKTALFYAVQQSNNESVVGALIDAGANVNITDNEGKTALIYALQQSNNESASESVVRALIDAGADVNTTDNYGQTALKYAVRQSNNTSVIHILIAAGANINITDNEGKTALFHAVQENTNVVRLLIDAGANINITDNEGKTALFYALQQRNNESVVHALIKAGADVNITDNEGKTALIYALQKSNNESMVHALIGAGGNINITDNEGKTALFYALQKSNNESMVHALIDAGADVNTTDRYGQTALIYAVRQSNDKSLVRLLIAAGANVNMTDNEGKTALFYAVQQSNNKSVVRTLIAAGADVNKTDNEGKTALFYALQQRNNESVVHALIKAGADVNVKYDQGKTALIYAVRQSNNESLVHPLIDAGANINKTDNEGKTALFYAVQQSNDESVVRTLIAAGADVNMTDNEGKTALFFVNNQDEKFSIVRALIDGGAQVDARDRYGRTPLYYAMTQSLSLARYLLDKGSTLQLDESGSVLNFFIEKCIFDFATKNLQDGFDLITKYEKPIKVNRKTIFKAIVNVAFCKTLCLKPASIDIDLDFLDKLMTLAKEYTSTKIASRNIKSKTIRKIKMIIVIHEGRYDKKLIETRVPLVLTHLIKMGANPNTTGSDGNSALHHATQLALHGATHDSVMEICQKLKELNVSLHITNHENETPLLYCLTKTIEKVYKEEEPWPAIKTQVAVCRFLVEHGSSVETKTRSGETALSLNFKLFQQSFLKRNNELRKCIFDAALELVNVILFNNPETTDSDGNTAFHHATQLALHGATHDSVMEICQRLQELKAPLRLTNHQSETPLLYCLTTTIQKAREEELRPATIKTQAAVFRFLVEHGARVEAQKTRRGETVLHLTIKLLQHIFFKVTPKLGECFTNAFALLQPIEDAYISQNLTSICSKDKDGNTPLHLWASIILAGQNYSRNINEAPGQDNSKNSRTALTFKDCQHLTLNHLINLDKSQLIAKNKNGESPLHLCRTWTAVELLLGVGANPHDVDSLGRTLLSVAAKNKQFFHDLNGGDTPLHICCKNIVSNPDADNVNWEIAELLILYKADYDVPDSTGQSCLDIAKECPKLKKLLLNQIDIDVPSNSKIHKDKLDEVAQRKNSLQIKSYWYHKDHLARGSFGAVFAGINEDDGGEVAIKRIEKIRMQRPEDKQEIKNLTALADCEQVVRYLCFFEDENFSYIILELMEGNLDHLLELSIQMDTKVSLCQDVVKGLKFLHENNIIHRDLKPTNILYKVHPQLCLKIADFGLSRRIDGTGSRTSVYGTNVGTRCWIAPEVIKSKKRHHSKSTDLFACGLVLHYILSVKKHPFDPPIEAPMEHETEVNILNGKMEGWDESLCPEADHLLKEMLHENKKERPTADEVLDHPFFWSKKKKLELLTAVGNQPEFKCPRDKKTRRLTAIETDLEARFGTIVKYVDWNNSGYLQMPAIYEEMTKKRKSYDTHSVVELVRFTRNSHAHVTDLPKAIQGHLLKDFVFLEYFPNLVTEVYKAVTTHEWDQTRQEIKHALS